MSRFDWVGFFQAHGVPYVTSGKNVRAGWVNIKCPLCGMADPSEHCGCNPETGGWACWRDRGHRGGGPEYLIQTLLRCDRDRAEALARAGGWGPPAPGDLEAALRAGEASPEPLRRLRLPPEFLPVHSERFRGYLLRRGFADVDDGLVQRYGLRECWTGDWAFRLILPLYVAGVGLVGWQGRAIAPARLRYVSHPGAIAKRVLFNDAEAAEGGETLVLVEGPMGALKVDWYGRREGVHAVGFMGANYTPAQAAAACRLAARYARAVVLFDPGAEATAYGLAADLAPAGRPVLVGELPGYAGGPDDLRPADVLPLVASCIRESAR